MSDILLIIALLMLDSVMGEPVWLWSRIPHPVQLMGQMIAFAEQRANSGRARRLKGALALAVLLAVFAGTGYGLAMLPADGMIELLLAAILVGHRSLVQHVQAVARGLRAGLPEGRRAVSMIVGRDVAALDESAVARAAIESGAENFSDGVVAPVFWFCIAGLPGIVAYKLVNTADSMIGHKTARYLEYGWAAARLDDVMNYLPARLSAVLIAVATGSWRAVAVVRADAGQHRSPNAGWPEAAMAGALGVALSGPRIYGGVPTEDAFVNATGRKTLGPDDIDAAVRVLWQAWGLMLAVFVGVAVWRYAAG
jgi:adenosylcobinamide-phosphate synthase